MAHLAGNMIRQRILPILIHRKLNTVLIVSIFILISIFSLISSPSAHAAEDGAIGAGGSSSGDSGGAQSSNGWGWYSYPSSKDTKPYPFAFANSNTWAAVSQTCRNVGADRVIAFIALSKYGSDPNNGKVFDYHNLSYDGDWKNNWDNFQEHRVTGGTYYIDKVKYTVGDYWLTTAVAKSAYTKTATLVYGSVDKAASVGGLVWGKNVGWFCYSAKTWEVSVTIAHDRGTANKASPGDVIKWTHTVKNKGKDPTNIVVNYYWQDYNSITKLFGSETKIGSLASNSKSTDTATSGNSTYTVNSADVGKTFCRYTVARPRSILTTGYIKAGPSCVTIIAANAWTIIPTVTSDKTEAYAGQKITWTHTVKNNGPNSTNAIVNYYWQSYNNITGQLIDSPTVFSTSLASNTADQITSSMPSTHDVSATDDPVGSKICRVTIAKPKSSTDLINSVQSAPSCVTIVAVPISWTIFPTATNNKAPAGGTGTAIPGETVTWTHTIKNLGQDATNLNVDYFYNDTNPIGTPTKFVAPSPLFTSGKAKDAFVSSESWYTVTASDVSKTICRVTIATPQNNNGGSVQSSPASCVYIPYDFNLSPFLTIDPNGVIEPGSSFDVSPSITNGGNTVNYPLADWTLKKEVIQPGSPTVTTFTQGTNLTIAAKAKADLTKLTVSDTLKNVDTKICFTLSVKNYLPSAIGGWISSPQVCITIGKRPKVQIWGGDLLSGGKIVTSSSVVGAKTFGSWIEYGIFANNAIIGAGSRSAYSGGLDYPSGTFCNNAVKLSFSNSNCDNLSGVGYYSSGRNIPDIAASFPVNNITSPKVLSGTSPSTMASGVYTVDGDINLSGGTIGKDKSIIINAAGKTVTISDNIFYDNSGYDNIDQISQLIIIADKIEIKGVVENIDSWLVAKDGINTCSDFVDATPLLNCDNPLKVNGPIIAGKLDLKRTAGSNTLGLDQGAPAETFNFRSDAYLWALNYMNNNNQIRTVYTTELPPRF